MNPEEIDKLFRDRLKDSAPTPPGDLWSRLQERIETEGPQQPQEEKKEARRGFRVWVNDYAAAAAVTLLLSVGIGAYKYNLEQNKKDIETGIAQTEVLKKADAEAPVTAPSEETTSPTAGIAAAPVQEQPAPEAQATVEAEVPAQKPKAIAKATTPKASATKAPAVERVWKAAPSALAVKKPDLKPQIEQETLPADLPATTAVFAANHNLNAAPVEIMIKRSMASEPAEELPVAEELSGMEKKQQMAKNIFKQVKNLANGESVELSELGIKADKIAIGTQIGKQKFSKVINL